MNRPGLDRALRNALTLALVLAALATPFAPSASFGAPPLPMAAPESVGMSKERLAKIGTAMKDAIALKDFPGAVVMVSRRGKLVYSETFGEQKPGTAMTDSAIFRIYSMTKPLVSVAAMLLVEDGKIQLTEPVGKYLPGFDGIPVSVETKDSAGNVSYLTEPAAKPMTLQDLLRHTSGIGYGEIIKNVPVKEGYQLAAAFRPDVPFDARNKSPADQIAALAKVPLLFQPGTTYNYGLSVDVLGRVIESASGKRLGEFLQTRLFGPLKMRDTGFALAEAARGRVVEPFSVERTTGQPNVLIDATVAPLNDSGGAGGFSTAGDYLRFCQMLLDGGILEGQRVMSPTSIRLMTSDHLGSYITRPVEPGEGLLGVKGYTFGLGFAVRKEDGLSGVPGSAGEFTWGGYAGTYFWVDPKEKLTAVMMTQTSGPLRAAYRRLVRQLVYQAIVE